MRMIVNFLEIVVGWGGTCVCVACEVATRSERTLAEEKVGHAHGGFNFLRFGVTRARFGLPLQYKYTWCFEVSQRSSEYQCLRVPVISAFSTLETREDSSHFSFQYLRDSRGLSHFRFWYPRDSRGLSHFSFWYPGDSQGLSHFNFWYLGTREDSVIQLLVP